MSDPKWTPGPWRLHHPGGHGRLNVIGPDTYAIALIYNQGLANARLIAGAPELYEALRPFGEVGKAFLDARKRLESGNGASELTLPAEWVEWCIRAAAVLAKARGESQ